MNLGEVLVSARTAARISIDDLALMTSIRHGLLAEMESNNFAHCGGDIYARGHLRNIAPHIALDPQQLIHLYNEEHSTESRKIHDMLVENNVTRIPTERKTISPKTLALVSIVVLAAIAVGQIIISNSKTTVAPAPIVSKSATATPSATASAAPSTSATAENVAPSTTGEMKLTIAATRGNSNIDVVVDGQHLFKGPIFQGDSKSFSAPNSISIYLSNAGDLDLTLNGEKLSSLGMRNQEIRKTFRSQ